MTLYAEILLILKTAVSAGASLSLKRTIYQLLSAILDPVQFSSAMVLLLLHAELGDPLACVIHYATYTPTLLAALRLPVLLVHLRRWPRSAFFIDACAVTAITINGQ